MNRRAFTLIEVMVVVAIISIMASMMLPAVWKWWENEEIATTKERLQQLKLAMVGDKRLVQNGVRTSYGFVGDNGELPFCNYSSNVETASLALLVNKPKALCGYNTWSGPYMSGFEPDVFLKDRWGKEFSYSLCQAADGRFLSGAIRSAGPNGLFDTVYDQCDTERSSTFCKNDDICVALDILEVAPTDKIKGNLNYVATSAGAVSNLSARIYAKIPYPHEPDGFRNLSSVGCIRVDVPADVSKTKIQVSINNILDAKLPVSNKILFKSILYATDNCNEHITITSIPSSETSVFVSDALSTISLDMPSITYTKP